MDDEHPRTGAGGAPVGRRDREIQAGHPNIGVRKETSDVRAWLRNLLVEEPHITAEDAHVRAADGVGLSVTLAHFRQMYWTPIRRELGVTRRGISSATVAQAAPPSPPAVPERGNADIVSANSEGESVRLIPDPDRPGLVRLVMDTGPITRAVGLRRMAAIFAALADAA